MNETPSKKNNYVIFIVGCGLCAAPIGVFAAFFGMAHRPFPTYAFRDSPFCDAWYSCSGIFRGTNLEGVGTDMTLSYS